MFKFFRKARKLPPFDVLKAYEFRNHYFRRTATWNWLDTENIVVIDPHSPRMITMDPWPQKIFLAADGQKTIEEYVIEVAHEYSGTAPALLDQTIIEELKGLLAIKIVELSTAKERPLPVYDNCSK